MKKYLFFSVFCAFVVLLLSGCVNVSYVGEYYPPHQNGIRVYMRSEDVPANTYRVMGRATATLDDGDAAFLSDSAVNEELHKKAQAVGADAMLILSTERRKTGVVANQSSSSSYHERSRDRGYVTHRNSSAYDGYGSASRGRTNYKNKSRVDGYDNTSSSQSVHDVYTQIVEAEFLKRK